MKKAKRALTFLVVIIAIGLFIPQNLIMPVQDAGPNDYNPESFWYYPWGKSVTHKGVDVFAERGRPVIAATGGLVVFSGKMAQGGNAAIVLGPKWRLHYYAHLQTIETSLFSWLWKKDPIGTVGTSGNAFGKQPHLHYSIVTLVPYPWRIDDKKQGWKKMFYLNPLDYFE
ncbi:MAG: M23 family metallopeptidase [Bacteroidia bacterium]